MQRSDPKEARLKPGYVLQAEDVVEFPMTDEDRRDLARGVELSIVGSSGKATKPGNRSGGGTRSRHAFSSRR